MAEGILLPFAKSVVGKIASFTGDLVLSSVSEKIKAAKSAKSDLKLISEDLEAICAVLADAEEKQYSNNAIKIWLRDLKSVVYDIDDLLDEVATDALQRRVNKGHLSRQLRYYVSSSNPLISRFDLSHKVKILRQKLDNIVSKKQKFNLTENPVEISRDEIRDPLDRCSYVHEPSIVGREAAKHDILNKILMLTSDTNTELTVLPIVGMGGIGKTAFAKLVYKDVDVLNFDLKLWACVSDTFQLQKIVQDIVQDGTGDNNLSSLDLNTLIKKLHKLLGGRKYFLVLDDVWEEDIEKWSKLKDLLTVGKAGSIILVTTRSNRVALNSKTVEPYNLESLSFDVCWSIFKKLAFAEGEEEIYKNLVNIGQSIVEKCNGNPLVVNSLGSMLRNERDEQQWQKIKNMDSFVGVQGEYEKKVLFLLKSSYNNLPSHLKPCFAYLSLYLKDTPLIGTDVIYCWRALGLLEGESDFESTGYSYLLELMAKSLIHEPRFPFNNLHYIDCRIYDMMHDLATNILGDELSIVTQDKMKVSEYTRYIIWGYEGSNSLKETIFPKELSKAPSIRSFSFGYEMNQVSRSMLEGIISNFTYLRTLNMRGSQFEELPKTIGNLKHLRVLNLSKNYSIRWLPNSICKLVNLESLNVYRCEKLEKLPDDIYLLQRLRRFIVTTCQVSLLGTKFNELSSLRYLVIRCCKRLTSLWDDCNIRNLTSLQHLNISVCPKLTNLPKSLKFLTNLESLSIYDCHMDLATGESLSGLQRLQLLIVQIVPNLKRLPQGIQSAAASLRDLYIRDCEGLVELPEWLQCFTSLHSVYIINCPRLSALPRSFCHLNSLKILEIWKCPQLSERLVPNGEDCSLVQHIPKVVLDGVTIS